MVAAYSDTSSQHKTNKDDITKLLEEQKIGGIIFFKGSAERQAVLTNYYQSLAYVPLLIGIDAEWGLVMRLDSVPKFPFQMTVAATQNDSLIYRMGKEIAKECRRLGVQEDFAPVIDINNNPDNPVIGMRSFGEDKVKVSAMGMAYMKGLQSENILSCGKHFPGHGDTKTDSHLDLPVINSPTGELDTLEMFPFRQLIKNGLSSIMVAHLYIPSLDSTPNRASTLSNLIVDSLLKKKMGFKGLVFTDALNMKGVTKYYQPGEVDLMALLAGNDILLFSENVPKAVEKIKNAIDKKEISQEEIDEHCHKILMAKAWVGLNHYKPIVIRNIKEDINTANADNLNREIAKETVTLLANKNNLIPLQWLDTLRIASLVIGDSIQDNFQYRMNDYTHVKHFNLPKSFSDSTIRSLMKQLHPYNLIILGIKHTGIHPADSFGVALNTFKILDTLLKSKQVIVDLFANPYLLNLIPAANRASAIILSYQDLPYILDYSAQLIFGGIKANGKLPVTCQGFNRNTGIKTPNNRFEFAVPGELGIASKALMPVDTLANWGIKQHAYPGCVILAVKDGKVFYKKAFGTVNWNDTVKVKTNDIYDLASITKIVATTAAIMKLSETKELDINSPISQYIKLPKKSKLKKITIKDILTHQSGLLPDILFWEKTMTGNKYRDKVYNTDSSSQYSIPVAAHLFLRNDYDDTIMKEIYLSPVEKKPLYKYSDLGMILLGEIIKNITGVSLDKYVENSFYKPLGLTTLCFNPLKHQIKPTSIIPTEYDSLFRKQLLRGYVHDPSAAMLGGVAGNAGLFSDAEDLAVIMQMYLNYGAYGGIRFFKSSTVDTFTTRAYFNNPSNRRGLGFDKPEPDKSKESPACAAASLESFGHSGFTGTYAWADPEYHLVYIFLSNRVASGSENNILTKLNIRTMIQQVFYNALKLK